MKYFFLLSFFIYTNFAQAQTSDCPPHCICIGKDYNTYLGIFHARGYETSKSLNGIAYGSLAGYVNFFESNAQKSAAEKSLIITEVPVSPMVYTIDNATMFVTTTVFSMGYDQVLGMDPRSKSKEISAMYTQKDSFLVHLIQNGYVEFEATDFSTLPKVIWKKTPSKKDLFAIKFIIEFIAVHNNSFDQMLLIGVQNTLLNNSTPFVIAGVSHPMQLFFDKKISGFTFAGTAKSLTEQYNSFALQKALHSMCANL
jgi:hypothetical protein